MSKNPKEILEDFNKIMAYIKPLPIDTNDMIGWLAEDLYVDKGRFFTPVNESTIKEISKKEAAKIYFGGDDER